jgi:hypothetical protein
VEQDLEAEGADCRRCWVVRLLLMLVTLPALGFCCILFMDSTCVYPTRILRGERYIKEFEGIDWERCVSEP